MKYSENIGAGSTSKRETLAQIGDELIWLIEAARVVEHGKDNTRSQELLRAKFAALMGRAAAMIQPDRSELAMPPPPKTVGSLVKQYGEMIVQEHTADQFRFQDFKDGTRATITTGIDPISGRPKFEDIELEADINGFFVAVRADKRTVLFPPYRFERSLRSTLQLAYDVEGANLGNAKTFAVIRMVEPAICTELDNKWVLTRRERGVVQIADSLSANVEDKTN